MTEEKKVRVVKKADREKPPRVILTDEEIRRRWQKLHRAYKAFEEIMPQLEHDQDLKSE